MFFADNDLVRLAREIAKRMRRSEFEKTLVESGLYSLSDFSGGDDDFSRIATKEDLALAVLTEMNGSENMNKCLAILVEKGAIEEDDISDEADRDALGNTAPKRAPSPMAQSKVTKRERFIKCLQITGAVCGILALIGFIVVLFIGDNLCNSPTPPTSLVDALLTLCPSGSSIFVTHGTPPPPTNGGEVDECETPTKDWTCDCISSEYWSIFTEFGPMREISDCIDLRAWGIAIQGGELALTVEGESDAIDQGSYNRRGLYSAFQEATEIEFNLNISVLETSEADSLTNLVIGVANSNPIDPSQGVFLIYQAEAHDETVYLKTRERGSSDDYLPQFYSLNEIHHIRIVATQVSVEIYVNGYLLVGPSQIPVFPAFYIGYLLPSHGRIQAVISGLEFK